jgi:hypothetical protein
VPPLDPIRLGEHVHGHLGWLAVLAFAHPAVLLRNRRRRAHWSVALAVVVSTCAAGLGIGLYGPYRERLRPAIFAASPMVGYWFERKEHLAFAAIVLGWAGAVAYFGAASGGDSARESLRRAAHCAFVAATLLSIAVAILGVLVATVRSF